MAFPFVFANNWETGAIEWDSETDDGSVLDIAHYTQLAAMGVRAAAPYSGAYCLRVGLNGGTDAAYLEEGDINIADNTLNWFHFNLFFGEDFDASADDTFNIFEALASGTVEVAFGARYVAATEAIQLGIGEVAPTSFGATIKRGTWYTVELRVDLDNSGGANDGSIRVFVTEEGRPASTSVYATNVTGLDQAAVTEGRLGCQNHLATTTGTILIDNFIQDDLQVFPQPRFPTSFEMTSTGHAFVGPGWIGQISLVPGAGTDNTLDVFDTDRQEDDGRGNAVLRLSSATSSGPPVIYTEPLQVHQGAYVVLAGTNPRAMVNLKKAQIYNVPAIRAHGRKVRAA